MLPSDVSVLFVPFCSCSEVLLHFAYFFLSLPTCLFVPVVNFVNASFVFEISLHTVKWRVNWCAVVTETLVVISCEILTI